MEEKVRGQNYTLETMNINVSLASHLYNILQYCKDWWTNKYRPTVGNNYNIQVKVASVTGPESITGDNWQLGHWWCRRRRVLVVWGQTERWARGLPVWLIDHQSWFNHLKPRGNEHSLSILLLLSSLSGEALSVRSGNMEHNQPLSMIYKYSRFIYETQILKQSWSGWELWTLLLVSESSKFRFKNECTLGDRSI